MIRGGINKAGLASLVLLFSLGIGFLCAPLFNTPSAFAENKFDVKVRITPQISLTTSTDTVAMNIIPEPAGSFVSNNVTATVSTNNATGYSLIMSTKGNDANLVNTVNSNNVITSEFNGAVTSSTMANGTWGYSLDATNFLAIPLAEDAAQINSSDEAVEGDSVLVTYGATVDSNTVIGTYEDTVVFTAIVSSDIVPEEEYTIFDITYMQEMTPLVCENTQTPNEDATQLIWNISDDPSYIPRTALIDRRDGTTYIITKYADGSCWMSENLEFELDSEGVTNEDTDLNTVSSWIPNNSTKAWEDENIVWGGDSWDTDRSIKAPVNQKFLLDGVTASATQPNGSTSYRWERVGIYYNWRAATAGMSHSATGTAENSICPKGWTLPSDDQLNYVAAHIPRDAEQSNKEAANMTPINLIYSGSVNSFGGNDRSLLNFGDNDGQGAFWGSNDGNGFMISYNWGGPRIQGYYKDIGLPVRCVARSE